MYVASNDSDTYKFVLVVLNYYSFSQHMFTVILSLLMSISRTRTLSLPMIFLGADTKAIVCTEAGLPCSETGQTTYQYADVGGLEPQIQASI